MSKRKIKTDLNQKQAAKKHAKPKADPHAEREKEKYANPIASREFILEQFQDEQAPMSLRQLATKLQLEDPEARKALKFRLRAMIRDGQLEQLSKRRYWPVGQREWVKGCIHFDESKTPWVIPDDGGPRVLLGRDTVSRTQEGYRVIASVPTAKKGEHPEGKIIEIVDQGVRQVTGRFVKEEGFQYVIPHGRQVTQDILIPEDKQANAQDGDIVVLEVMDTPTRWREPVGQIKEVLGSENQSGIEIEAAIHAFDLPNQWPDAVQKEMQQFSDTVPLDAIDRREDLRALPFVTIDGEDAKDFDDAVYCEPTRSGGWKLLVAIADVSYYVRPHTPLDKEAEQRGNSVYFPGRVIPMLPEKLSNGLCSLKPNVDRLCMVAEMNISETGKLTRYHFYEAVICSKARLTYTQVAKLLSEESDHLRDKYQHLLEHLFNLHTLYTQLRKEREARGAIDFETVETRIVFGNQGKIKRIEPTERNVAHKIIEECMLAANVATARFLTKNKLPGLYRIHEGPPDEKLADLKVFLAELGLSIGKQKKITPADYGKLLIQIKDRPDAQVIQTVLLRSLSQAVYSSDNVGHFGLAYPAYSHFTSPIRRYPDLLVHRKIRMLLSGVWAKEAHNHGEGTEEHERLKELGIHCSLTERRADDATRDVVRWLKCQYISERIGETYTGVISGVTRFGFFVELDDLYIDGLVHITGLGSEYYEFDAIHHRLVGDASGKVYGLGQSVTVRVVRVDVDQRKVDFDLIASKSLSTSKNKKDNEHKKEKKKRKRKRSRRKKS